jgi:hypothetical protein
MKAYKLTTQDFKTRKGLYSELIWGEGVEHTATGLGDNLCSDGWIHFYNSPLIAVIMNPIHATIPSPVLWECLTYGKHKREVLKSGCKRLKTVRQLPLPQISTTSRIAFSILCAKKIYHETNWTSWANAWLSGADRTAYSANAAAYSANAAAAAYSAVAYSVAYHVAYSAAANAAYSANAVAYHVAANLTTHGEIKIPFIKLLKQAMKIT